MPVYKKGKDNHAEAAISKIKRKRKQNHGQKTKPGCKEKKKHCRLPSGKEHHYLITPFVI